MFFQICHPSLFYLENEEEEEQFTSSEYLKNFFVILPRIASPLLLSLPQISFPTTITPTTTKRDQRESVDKEEGEEEKGSSSLSFSSGNQGVESWRNWGLIKFCGEIMKIFTTLLVVLPPPPSIDHKLTFVFFKNFIYCGYLIFLCVV